MRDPHLTAIGISVILAVASSATAAAPPRVSWVAPPEIVSGATVELSAWLVVEEPDVLSWSLATAFEEISAVGVTTEGTDFARLSSGGYAESRLALDGSVVTSVAALSFSETVTLPAGTSEVLRVNCRATRKDPGEAAIVPRDGIETPDGSFRNAVLVTGGEVVPLVTSRVAVPVRGCAALIVSPEGLAPVGPVTTVEVWRDVPLAIEFLVEVRSEEHLHPTGFDLAISHDASLLRIDGAEFLESFIDEFVEADGFARFEISAGGLAASVVSSSSNPNFLATGTHRVLRAAYSYVGGGRPGDSRRTRLRLTEPLALGAGTASTVFRPGAVDPCSMDPVELDLVVGPDRWIRGDADGDGRANISDAIHLLEHLFVGVAPGCKRAMEVNGDSRLDLSDAIFLLNHLFLGAPAPPAPYPSCGVAEDELPCDVPACPA